MLNLDGDFPRHLLTGKYILENRTVPTTELFIHPYLHRPNVSHSSEWLSDVIFYATYSYRRIGWRCGAFRTPACVHIYPAIQQVIHKVKPSNSDIYHRSLGRNCHILELGNTSPFDFHVPAGNMAYLDR